MGAADFSVMASKAAARNGSAGGRAAAQMRKDADLHFSKSRAAILTGDEHAITEACDGLIDHFQHSSELRKLVRVALSQGCDTTGREFLRILKDVMQMNAEHDAVSLER